MKLEFNTVLDCFDKIPENFYSNEPFDEVFENENRDSTFLESNENRILI